MKLYINMLTGEITTQYNIIKAWLYYYRDAKHFKYAFKLRNIVRMINE